MTLESDAHAGLIALIDDLTDGADDPLAQVAAARILKEQLPAVSQELVDKARTQGASWQGVASASGLKNPSSAFWHYGRGKPEGDASPATKADRLAVLRGQSASTRTPRQPAPEMPGLTRKEASERMGCDPKTVASRAEKQDGVRAEEFTSRSGKTVHRYFIL